MNNIKNFYKNIISYNLITKNNYSNIFEILNINKIILNIGFKNSNTEKKKLIIILVLLKIITNKNPLVTKSKKNKILLKIKKNSIVGCKIELKKNDKYYFLEKLLIFIFPTMDQNFIKLNNKINNILNFKINNILNFFELESEFLKFKDIPNIDISIQTNSTNNNNLQLLFNQYYFPIK